MVIAIILGVIAGIAGFAPLVVALARTKHNPKTGNFAPMAKLLIGLVVSFAILAICAVLYVAFDKPNALPFVLAEALTLCIIAIAYGINTYRDGKKEK